MKLADVLPEFVSDMESALAHLGRGDLIAQLKEVMLERWAYDDFTDTTYLHLRSPSAPNLPAKNVVDATYADRLSLYDELGVNLDSDDRGRLCGIEVLDGRRVTSQLGNAAI